MLIEEGSGIYDSFALAADGEMTVEEQTVIVGNLHTNDKIDLKPGSSVTGDVSATGEIKADGDVSGAVLPGASYLELGDLPDPDELQQLADRVLSGDQVLTDEVVDDILFVNGKVEVFGQLNGSGTIIATAEIKLSEGLVELDTSTKLSLIAYKQIEVGKDRQMRAVLRTQKDVKVDEGAGIEGSIVADEKVEIKKTATIKFLNLTAQDPPEITDRLPVPDTFVPSLFPTISASFSSASSEIDPSSVVLEFDGLDVSQDAVVSTEGVAWSANQAEEEGVHTIGLTVADLVGNSTTSAWSFSIDATPPTILITEPPDTVTSNPTPTVIVTYEDALSGVDPPTLQIVVAGEDIAPTCTVTASDATCTSPPLTHGFHSIAAQIADAAGHTGSDTHSFQVLLDLAPPEILIAEPSNGVATSHSTIEVSGTVTDDGEIHSVTVDGDEVALVDGAFSHQVTLSEGVNGILVTAIDVTGKISSASVSVIHDVTPPTVEIETPIPGATVNSPTVTVRGRVSDDHGVDTLAVDGQVVAIDDRFFEQTVDLTPGSNAINVTAIDRAGNATQELIDVEFFTLPEIAIDAPQDLSTIAATTTDVTGTVDASAVAVTVNGVAASLSGTSFSAPGVPLIEGGNTLTATVTNTDGHVATDSVTVLRDTRAPLVRVYTPADGAAVFTDTVQVAGLINDIVAGTVNSSEATVTVNGLPAQVANRSFLVEGVALAVGDNLLEVIAIDASGNSSTTATTVTRETPAGQRIELVSGSGQTGVIGSKLSQPLVARVVDSAGLPLPGVPVVFSVERGNGGLEPVGGDETIRKLLVNTDASGEAAAEFTLGSRAGIAAQSVVARAAGYAGRAEFLFSSLAGTPELVVVDAHGLQVGIPNRALPRPLVAAVVDAGSNRLAQVRVRFAVIKGGGSFEGGVDEIVIETDSDGRAIVPFSLGPEEGIANNAVSATIDGLAESPVATFVASAKSAGDPGETSISGVVLDNTNLPVPGVTARIRGSSLTAVADAQGRFTIANAPVGAVDLIIDGSTASAPGSWPDLEYDLVTIPGRDNTVGGPIYLLPLDLGNGLFVTETQGGTLTLPDLPGFALEITAGSVTFPGGSKSGVVSVTGVHYDKVPMTPTFGQQPRLIVTIQPAGALFDPPARLTLPNVDGLAPGEVTEMYSFDHDLGTFVSIGPATTSEDATVVVADPGVGILKAGWHSGGPPVPTGTPHDCNECEIPAGECVPNPEEIECDDHDDCTINDRCQGGECKGDDIFIENVDGRADGEDFLLTTVRKEVRFSVDLNTNCPNPEFDWDFDDDQTSTEQTPTHEYELVGRFKPKVTVTCLPCEAVRGEDEVNVHAATPDVTVVAWVDRESVGYDSARAAAGIDVVVGLESFCSVTLTQWLAGFRDHIETDADRRFANAFLLYESSNEQPPPTIEPNAAKNASDYRLFNRLKAIWEATEGIIENPLYLQQDALVGPTPNPCVGGSSLPAVHASNGAIMEGQGLHAYQLAEGRLGSVGQQIDYVLNKCTQSPCGIQSGGETTPWIWSVIKFDAAGEVTLETQVFPTYYIYENNDFKNQEGPGDVDAFISLDKNNSEKLPQEIQ